MKNIGAPSSFKSRNIIDVPLDPSRPDALGVEDYIKGSAAFLKNSSMPMTMSIQGAWGSGKTSFMLKLRQQLCEGRDAPYYGVWVRAWEHSSFAGQGEGSAPAMTMVSMLNSMIRDILPIVEENKSRGEQFLEKGRKAMAQVRKLPMLQMMAAGAGGFMLSAAAQTAVNALGATAKLASAANAPQAEEAASCSGETPISRLRADLAENIRFCVERSGRRGFIFFIDDLDRLAPSVAVGFIELLKNIFDLGSCIFVLAIDYDVVVKGLRDKFGDKTESNEHEFRSFFDKIIQVPFTMPMSRPRCSKAPMPMSWRSCWTGERTSTPGTTRAERLSSAARPLMTQRNCSWTAGRTSTPATTEGEQR